MIEPKKFFIGTDGEISYYVEAVNVKQALLKFAEYVGISDMDLLKKYYPTYTTKDTVRVINKLSNIAIKSVLEIKKAIYSDGDDLGYDIYNI